MNIEPESIRRQVSTCLHRLDRMSGTQAYDLVYSVLDALGEILDEIQTLIESDDERHALLVLKAFTEAYLAEWEILDGSSGATGDFFEEIASVWVDALSGADLGDEEREIWLTRVTKWQEQLNADYGLGDAFDQVVATARGDNN